MEHNQKEYQAKLKNLIAVSNALETEIEGNNAYVKQ